MEKLLCPKYETREASITPEEALKVEGLFHEKAWRKNLLAYIKRNGIQITPAQMAEYRKEYFSFAIGLEEVLAELVAKYAGSFKRYRNARANYKQLKLYWDEEV